MTFIEGIVGLVASVIAIVTALVLAVRYLGKKFDKWVETQVQNTRAVQLLTVRVVRLERTLKIDKDNV